MFNQKIRRRVAVLLLAAFSLSVFNRIEAEASPIDASVPTISAPAAIEMDFESGEVLYAKEADTPRPVASLTKMMTALIIYEGVRDGRWSWSTPVPISEKNRAYAAKDPCGAKIRMGKTESLRDLTDLTLIISSNAAARILAEFVSGSEANFVTAMNQRAAALGLQARYGDAAGLKWNMVTPRANANLMRHFIQHFPEVTMVTGRHAVTFKGKTFYNVNLLYTRIPTPGADGFKSGWMPFSGYCFAGTAKRQGKRILTVVMKAPTYEGSYRDSRKLINDGFVRLQHRQNKPAVTATTSVAPSMPASTSSEAQPTAPQTLNTPAPLKEESTVVARPLAAVKTSAWALTTIEAATARGLSMQEKRGAQSFEGQAPLTRSEFIAILMAAIAPDAKPAESAHFSDIPVEAWYADAVQAAYERGITNGVSADHFAPDTIINREQMAVLLVNSLQLPIQEEGIAFKDAEQMTPNMRSSVQTVVANHLMAGTSPTIFSPKAIATREQATIIVYRLLKQLDKSNDGLFK